MRALSITLFIVAAFTFSSCQNRGKDLPNTDPDPPVIETTDHGTSTSHEETETTGSQPVEETTTPELTPLPDPEGLVYSWKTDYDLETSIARRIPPPAGYERIPVEAGSYGEWLRHLPLKPGRPKVMLHDGSEKWNQEAHHSVIDIDVGKADLQQCADAVMRVRAEYLYANDRYDDIHFNFVSGDKCDWNRWRAGNRIRVSGSNVTWSKTASPSDSYATFKKYLRMVYMYAGTASLTHELTPVASPKEVEIGDVFIIGGSPGHAVAVVDVAEKTGGGERMFMIAQSYMPAQDMHVLQNLNDESLSPWYPADFTGTLRTPEWNFEAEDLKRF